MNLLRKALGAFDRTINFMAFLAGLLLGLLMLIVCYEVVMRYVFRAPSGWVVEICEYMLLYTTFLGTAWLLKVDGHIRVDIVFAGLTPVIQRVFSMATSLMGAVSCSFLFLYGLSNTLHHLHEGTLVIQTLNTPKWMLMAIIPIGSVLLVIQFLRNFFGLLYSPEVIEGANPEQKEEN
jgi:C4-dicarboxylate transporter DctQ subunit